MSGRMPGNGYTCDLAMEPAGDQLEPHCPLMAPTSRNEGSPGMSMQFPDVCMSVPPREVSRCR